MLWKHQSGGFLPHDMPHEDAPALEEEGPLDDMRAEEQPEPNVNDEPMPSRA